MPKIRKSKFNLSYENKFTCNMGELVPFLVQEVVPGQTARFGANVLLRTQPLVAPVMHRIDCLMWYIYVPYRLLQDNFEDFMTGGLQGNANISSPLVKSPSNTGWTVGSLADYLNYPTDVPNFEALAWGFRAYAKSFNDYFVNENVTGQELPLSTGDGLDTTTNTTLQNKNWRRDYFTGVLPWPQRGPEVYLPMGTSAPVSLKTSGLVADEVYHVSDGSKWTGLHGVHSDGGIIIEENNGLSTSSYIKSSNYIADLSSD